MHLNRVQQCTLKHFLSLVRFHSDANNRIVYLTNVKIRFILLPSPCLRKSTIIRSIKDHVCLLIESTAVYRCRLGIHSHQQVHCCVWITRVKEASERI